MPTVFVPLEEQTVALALLARQQPDESLDSVFRRSVARGPELPAPNVAKVPRARQAAGRYTVDLCRERVAADSLGRLLQAVVALLADIDAGCLKQIALKKGRTRPVIARSREALYPGNPHLRRHSLPLPDGWYIGTNVSRADAKRILRLICAATGLTYNVDLVPDF